MARKRLGKAQLRRRYDIAGWVGLGVLAALVLGTGLLAFNHGGDPPAGERSALAPAAPDAPSPGASSASPPETSAGSGPASRPDPGLLERGPRAAIIIDDLGNNWAEARAVSDLPYPVAVAVLPDTPYAAKAARRAHSRGKEVLAHIPMEPASADVRLGPHFLRTGMGREQLVATLNANLAGIPYVQGVNNHMGSRLTSRARPMGWVMQALRDQGLYFIDSRTTAATKALSQARSRGLPAAERDVFLDHEPSEAAIRAQFRELLDEARDKGTAIAIGHPHPATLKVLRDLLPEASRQGVEIVPLREVVAVRNRRAHSSDPVAYHQSNNGKGGAP